MPNHHAAAHPIPTPADEAPLVARAADGDQDAFDALQTQYLGPAWRLAYALVGQNADAVAVVSGAFARSFTALRAEWAAATTRFETLLLTNVRNGALDLRGEQDRPSTFEPDRGDIADVAAAFDQLPEPWRATLWLTEVEGLGMRTTASVVDVPTREVSELVGRARRGLRETWLQAATATGTPRSCQRAVGRLTRHVEDRLPADEAEKVERHLRLCDPCRDRFARLDRITLQLAWLVPAMPPQLEDEARGAWASIFAVDTGFGLSSVAERVLAGVTATAAAVGVFGATLAVGSSSSRTDQAVAPIAPIVTELASPRPADLDIGSVLDADAFTGDAAGAPVGNPGGADADLRLSRDAVHPTSESRDGAPRLDDQDDTTSGGTDDSGDGGGDEAPATDGSDTSGPGTNDPGTESTEDPILSAGTTVGDTPVAVEVGEDSGATVGPVSVGSEPEPGDDVVETGGSLDGLDDVVEPVDDGLSDLGL